MTNKSLGFDKEQVLVIKRAGGLGENKAAFKNELLKHSGISSVSYTETTPGRHFNGHGQHFAGRPDDESKQYFHWLPMRIFCKRWISRSWRAMGSRVTKQTKKLF
jgi:hypothetical protein